MNDETNNEPKSLAEMTKEDLLAEYFDADINHTLPEWQKIRAEVLRRMEAGEELARIDEALARRPALVDLNDRYSKVYRACEMAGRAESAEAEARRLREALERIAQGIGRWVGNGAPAGQLAAEPHTLTREQVLVKALEVLRDKWPQSHADFRGMALIELLDYQRSLIAGLMADFVLSLSPSTRPSGDGWIKCSERLPEEDEPVLIAVRCEADDHGTEMTVTFPEVHRGTIYTAPNMIIAATDDGCEYENTVSGAQEILGWQPIPSPPTEEKGPSR